MKKWDREEVDIIKKYYSSKSNKELKKFLPFRTLKAISRKAEFLGIKKSKSYLSFMAARANPSSLHASKKELHNLYWKNRLSQYEMA